MLILYFVEDLQATLHNILQSSTKERFKINYATTDAFTKTMRGTDKNI